MFEKEVVLKAKTEKDEQFSLRCPFDTNLYVVKNVLKHMLDVVSKKIEEVEEKREEQKDNAEEKQAEGEEQSES